MVLGKRVAIFYWEWGLNSAPREGQKIPWKLLVIQITQSRHPISVADVKKNV